MSKNFDPAEFLRITELAQFTTTIREEINKLSEDQLDELALYLNRELREASARLFDECRSGTRPRAACIRQNQSFG
jgi:hypothetical protein